MMFAAQAEVDMQPKQFSIGGISDLQRAGWRRVSMAGFTTLALAGYGLILAPPVAAMPSQTTPTDVRAILASGMPANVDDWTSHEPGSSTATLPPGVDASFAWNPTAYATAEPWERSWDGNALAADAPMPAPVEPPEADLVLGFETTAVAAPRVATQSVSQNDAAGSFLPSPDVVVQSSLNIPTVLSEADDSASWTPAPTVVASLDAMSVDSTIDGPNVMADAMFAPALTQTTYDANEPTSIALMVTGLLGLVLSRCRQA
jgi:hypothetical protein